MRQKLVDTPGNDTYTISCRLIYQLIFLDPTNHHYSLSRNACHQQDNCS